MTLILRKLQQKRYWDQAPWLGAHDVQADATKCLTTKENELSVFKIDNQMQVRRVVAALALTRDNLAYVDLAIIPESVLKKCGIKRDKNPAGTPDLEVNEWHLNLVELTAAKIANLASAIRSDGKITRCQQSHVQAAIKDSLCFGQVEMEKIKKNVTIIRKKRVDTVSSNI